MVTQLILCNFKFAVAISSYPISKKSLPEMPNDDMQLMEMREPICYAVLVKCYLLILNSLEFLVFSKL